MSTLESHCTACFRKQDLYSFYQGSEIQAPREAHIIQENTSERNPNPQDTNPLGQQERSADERASDRPSSYTRIIERSVAYFLQERIEKAELGSDEVKGVHDEKDAEGEVEEVEDAEEVEGEGDEEDAPRDKMEGDEEIAETDESRSPASILTAAADKFASDLLRQDEVKLILIQAASSDSLCDERFERNLRRLLTQLSWSLKKIAREPAQKAATTLLRWRSRYIAHGIQQALTAQNVLQSQDGKFDNRSEIEKFLEGLQRNSPEIQKSPQEKAESDSEAENDFPLHESVMKDVIANLSSVKNFMIGSEGFLDFRASLWNLVDPSLKSKLCSIRTDISDSEFQVMATEVNRRI